MSKERLEEMNKKVVGLIDGEDFSDLVQMDVDTYAWFYEQAERVGELEEMNIDAITQIDVTQRRNERLEKRVQELKIKNKRYKQALEFYADRDNYKLEHFDPNLDDYMSTVDYDEGMKARQAFEGEE